VAYQMAAIAVTLGDLKRHFYYLKPF